MKSINEFATEQDYKDYLRIYLSAQFLSSTNMNRNEDSKTITDKIVIATNYADALINTLFPSGV